MTLEQVFDCIIIYSSQKHVENIENIIWHIKKVLEEKNYNPLLLRNEIRSNDLNRDSIISLIEKATFGIIIFDGFRPNVLFELGLLVGQGKCIIVIKSSNAEINIKTLYNLREGEDPKKKTGLTDQKFNKGFINPKLDIDKHFSDFAGTNVPNFDNLKPESLREVLNEELEKIKDCIEKYTRNSKDQQALEEPKQELYYIRSIQLSNVLMNEEKFEQSEEILSDLEESIANRDDFLKKAVYLSYALLFFRKKNYEKAIVYNNKALEIDPNFIKALVNKGVALDNLKRYDEAIQLYDKVLKIDPNDINTLNNKGVTLDNLKRYDEAIQLYDKVLKIETNNIDALVNKGVALDNLKRYEKAIQLYDKVLEIDPKDIEALVNKGVALWGLKKYDEAIQLYDKVLKIDPKDIEALVNKGVALDNLKRYDEAIQLYDKVLKFDPKDMDAYYNKACIESKKNNKDEALNLLKKAIEFDAGYKIIAKKDSDFDNIRDSDEFKDLISD